MVAHDRPSSTTYLTRAKNTDTGSGMRYALQYLRSISVPLMSLPMMGGAGYQSTVQVKINRMGVSIDVTIKSSEPLKSRGSGYFCDNHT